MPKKTKRTVRVEKLTTTIHPYITKTNDKYLRGPAKKFGVSYSRLVDVFIQKARTGKPVTVNGFTV